MEVNEYENLIGIIDGLNNKKDEELKKLPYHLNVISSAVREKNLKEVAHTMILADLLNYPKIQESFLKYFFSIEDINGLEVEREIRVKLGQPDIILCNDTICIIIENKVNAAPEQIQQCGRYYIIARDKLASKIDKEQIAENIYFLYLNPNDRSLPSKDSLMIPDSAESVTTLLGERFVVRSFAQDIRAWLDQLYNELTGSNCEENKNKFLISGIYQYMDYLDYKFETDERFSDMYKELETYLAKGTGTIGKFDTIKKLSDLNKQAKVVSEIVTKIIFEKNKEEIKNIKEYATNVFDVSSNEDNEYGIMKKVDDIIFCIETNRGDDKIFYGIKCKSFADSEERKKYYSRKLKEMNAESCGLWPIYKYASSTTSKEIYNEFKNFVDEITNYTI